MNTQLKTQIEVASDWICNLRFEDIPPEVISLAKLQVLDGISAICAGSRSTSGIRIFASLNNWEVGGPCTVLPNGNKWSLFQTVYFHSAMINTLELDNFAFMGHLGQSALSASLSVGELLNSNGRDFLLALIAAQEVGGRLGAYLANGPQQGHMRSFIHRTAAAVVTGKLLGFDRITLTQSIAIALSMPEFPLYPASFSPDTKVISTSASTVEGIRAAFLAKEGLDGAIDIIEHPVGFFTYFSYQKKIPVIWEHLGKSWVALALSFKIYASCAYAQGPVSAALQIRQSVGFNPFDIEKVDITCPLLTIIMEKFSKPHTGSDITPVNTHFSTCRSVAAALLYGDLTGDFYENGIFEKRIPEIKKMLAKITLTHDWQLTINMIKGIDKGLVGAGKPGLFSFGAAGEVLDNFKKAFGSRPLFQIRDIPHLMKLPYEDQNYILKRFWRTYRANLPFLKGGKKNYRSHEGDLSKMCHAIGGKVIVNMVNGKRFESSCDIPPGFCGSAGREEEVVKKYFREATPVLGNENTRKVRCLIEQMPEINVKNLLEIF